MKLISRLVGIFRKYTTGQLRCADCDYAATTEQAIADSLRAADDDQPAVKARVVDSCPNCDSERLHSTITGGVPDTDSHRRDT